jgi:acyl-CoA synthetase (NDP forming)
MDEAAHRLEQVLNPGSIAIVGASGDANRIGGVALDLLARLGYAGQVYPVNGGFTFAL